MQGLQTKVFFFLFFKLTDEELLTVLWQVNSTYLHHLLCLNINHQQATLERLSHIDVFVPDVDRWRPHAVLGWHPFTFRAHLLLGGGNTRQRGGGEKEMKVQEEEGRRRHREEKGWQGLLLCHWWETQCYFYSIVTSLWRIYSLYIY